MVSTSELSITSGSTLHQLTARVLINDWEEGLLARDHLHHQVSRWVYWEGVINNWEEGLFSTRSFTSSGQ